MTSNAALPSTLKSEEGVSGIILLIQSKHPAQAGPVRARNIEIVRGGDCARGAALRRSGPQAWSPLHA